MVDEGEGLVDDTVGTVELHQVALALKDGEVAATGQFPQAHVGIEMILEERVDAAEEVPTGDGAVALADVVELLYAQRLRKVVDVFAPLIAPVGSAVGVLLVGDAVEGCTTLRERGRPRPQ